MKTKKIEEEVLKLAKKALQMNKAPDFNIPLEYQGFDDLDCSFILDAVQSEFEILDIRDVQQRIKEMTLKELSEKCIHQ